ncbi:MAG TPA: hypothetical protein VFX03_08070, partial [Thermomicrobiales bacterium]|nr:hypothetical protein [Thermomicrobiales bacterium]
SARSVELLGAFGAYGAAGRRASGLSRRAVEKVAERPAAGIGVAEAAEEPIEGFGSRALHACRMRVVVRFAMIERRSGRRCNALRQTDPIYATV